MRTEAETVDGISNDDDINITDMEQSLEQPPNVAGTGGGQPDEAPMEHSEVAKPEEPTGEAKDGGVRAGSVKTSGTGNG